ncbi:hypothetical protein C5167_000872 [Papaver somniferum]|uniref:Uncharacterized protein n=1 Tax=Papaver somniferum TaxID=3469 RepID=A0A4Y7KWI8_PAPSO|nr:hypothetical protein C5167_000872 [Papaver somniferum]
MRIWWSSRYNNNRSELKKHYDISSYNNPVPADFFLEVFSSLLGGIHHYNHSSDSYEKRKTNDGSHIENHGVHTQSTAVIMACSTSVKECQGSLDHAHVAVVSEHTESNI